MALSTANIMPAKYFSIVVEYVATGIRHDERSVAIVAVVDQYEKVVLKRVVKVIKPILSYLTPLTGLRPGDLDKGEDLVDIIRDVKAILGPDVVIVGQGLKNVIERLDLKQGEDFSFTVDLAVFFKVYTPRFGNYTFFTLHHEAKVLLGQRTDVDHRNPCQDALICIQLFKKYYVNPELKNQDQQRLLSTRQESSWIKRNDYRWEGVCLAYYRPKSCFCGAPTLQVD